MMVVGAFLINSVTAFYLEDFYSQMSDVFSDPGLVSDLTTETPDEENGAERMADVLDAYVGVAGGGRAQPQAVYPGQRWSVPGGS